MQAPTSAGAAAWRPALYAALAVLGSVAIFLPKLALFTLVGTFLAYLALPRLRPRSWLVLTAIAALTSTLGFVRFVLHEAIPGILQGGTAATEASAVSRLREMVFAQDVVRRRAAIDPDGDGIGSAALVGELLGNIGLRGGLPLSPPALERYPEPVETRLGKAIPVAGYLFIVCLPTPGGGWTARPGDAIDDEAAERRFLAYAWPAAENTGLLNAYFIDEHERILFARSGAPAGRRSRTGLERPPSCDDALAPATREQWQVWRGKQARAALPGDRPR